MDSKKAPTYHIARFIIIAMDLAERIVNGSIIREKNIWSFHPGSSL